jgi:hypothetical protein
MSNGVEITNCVFEKNKTRITSASSNACGAISLAQQSSSYRVGPSVIKNSSFIENQSIGGTGAVYTYILELKIDGSTFKKNTSVNGSSTIYNSTSVLKIYNSLFDGNETQAATFGAIYLENPVSFTDINNSTCVYA